MWKFVMFGVACYVLYKLFINDRKKKVDVKNSHDENLAKEGVLVKDPVCGTYVSKDTDIRIKEGAEVRCFCSYECRDKYLERIRS